MARRSCEVRIYGILFPFTFFFLTLSQDKDFWSEAESDLSYSVIYQRVTWATPATPESIMEQVSQTCLKAAVHSIHRFSGTLVLRYFEGAKSQCWLMSLLNFPEFLQCSWHCSEHKEVDGTSLVANCFLAALGVALPLGTASWRCSCGRDYNVYW